MSLQSLAVVPVNRANSAQVAMRLASSLRAHQQRRVERRAGGFAVCIGRPLASFLLLFSSPTMLNCGIQHGECYSRLRGPASRRERFPSSGIVDVRCNILLLCPARRRCSETVTPSQAKVLASISERRTSDHPAKPKSTVAYCAVDMLANRLTENHVRAPHTEYLPNLIDKPFAWPRAKARHQGAMHLKYR